MTNPAPSPLSSPATEMEPRPRLLTELLDKAVADYAERTAIDFLGRCWTYGEIGHMVDRAARGLQDQGLKPGDRFGLCLPNTPYFVILYFAALRIGAIVVNFNPLYTERELEHQIRDSGTRMMAVPDVKMIHDKVQAIAAASGLERVILCGMADVLPPLQAWGFTLIKRKDHAVVRDEALHVRFRALIARDAPPDPVAAEPDDIAVLQYTGGTTGVPKGAMLTHANLTANSAQMLIHVGGLRAGQERTLGVLPLFHVFALTTVLNFSVEIGAEMVLLPRFEMDQVLKTIRRKPPTQFFGVPTIYVAMNGLPDDKVPDLSAVRACISGGAPLPLDVRERFEQRTGARVVEGYGLSETSPIIACNPLDGRVKNNSCGPRFPGTILEIRDPENPARLLPQGERGEVCARGPQVMKGYWNKPEETAAVFVDGALRTGDIGYLDEDGYLFLVDRIKDVILCGGYNVYPRVIEDAAYQHPDIREAIAIGIDDPYRGQSPKLFVALREGSALSAEALGAFLAERLSKIEIPKEIEIRDALPKTLIGKLSKKELIEEERKKRA
ncbi:dicarboxylate--CoA ligase PimA [Sphingobium jiangsuense]|uniref:Long-chain acyl-CoA synthetase n=1 Tax=Sphingobium jiangsuense TaxID=870476 RepID=A0A7W6BNT4_9SPHN|nr:long-chain fatty acid--CoA ligase [Sphingobium jiangsuense]MBB3928577.1 long-chain acyl-CoA synthetase [Sphingobium jiangsuense]GLT00938.1 dicarboxylate--CoA ligase PimA [Sphingobium jiangsuense]